MRDQELAEAFERSEINLLVELRTGNGFDEKEYEKLVEALTACANEWECRNSIPKKAVYPLIELYDELVNFSFIYTGERGVRIKNAAENLKKLIHRCTSEEDNTESEKVKVIAKLSEYIKEDGNFFTKLQNGKGIDEQQFEKIYDELNDISDEIHTWESFPKSFVNILIDLCELDLFVHLYQDEFHLQEEADKIYDAYERIFGLIFG
ncbi:hypothetical protein [Psychrobacillus sp. NPDC093180]|uniref:hypothetical protein n=1 Tax=Psychrobacillus sp. NPDC093180 TaxID=3364489 RepID=UPI00382186C3